MDRRDFVLAGSAAAALSSLQWLQAGGLMGSTSGAAAADSIAATADANATADAALAALIRAVLPFDDTRFAAIKPATIQERLNALFGVSGDPQIRQNLAVFDALRLFAAPPPALLATEMETYPAIPPEKSDASALAARQARDEKAYAAWHAPVSPQAQSFADLRLPEQRSYVMLWAHSALGTRRRFYASMKTLIMAATYSSDQVWPIIGYAGPILHLHHA
jgi:hypothetical protein